MWPHQSQFGQDSLQLIYSVYYQIYVVSVYQIAEQFSYPYASVVIQISYDQAETRREKLRRDAVSLIDIFLYRYDLCLRQQPISLCTQFFCFPKRHDALKRHTAFPESQLYCVDLDSDKLFLIINECNAGRKPVFYFLSLSVKREVNYIFFLFLRKLSHIQTTIRVNIFLFHIWKQNQCIECSLLHFLYFYRLIFADLKTYILDHMNNSQVITSVIVENFNVANMSYHTKNGNIYYS